MSEYQPKPLLTLIRERKNKMTRSQYHGIMILLVGISLLPISLSFAIENNAWMFVIGTAGWLLIGIGGHLVLGRRSLESSYNSEKIGKLNLVILTLFTIAVIFSSIYGLQ